MAKFLGLLLLSAACFSKNLFHVCGGMGPRSWHYGGQFIMYVSEMHAWGPEFMFLKKGRKEYVSVCIVLEARLFRIMVNQMGLAGYLGKADIKPFGIRLSTGLDLPLYKGLSFPVMLRTDIIFDSPLIYLTNIEIGARIKF